MTAAMFEKNGHAAALPEMIRLLPVFPGRTEAERSIRQTKRSPGGTVKTVYKFCHRLRFFVCLP